MESPQWTAAGLIPAFGWRAMAAAVVFLIFILWPFMMLQAFEEPQVAVLRFELS